MLNWSLRKSRGARVASVVLAGALAFSLAPALSGFGAASAYAAGPDKTASAAAEEQGDVFVIGNTELSVPASYVADAPVQEQTNAAGIPFVVGSWTNPETGVRLAIMGAQGPEVVAQVEVMADQLIATMNQSLEMIAASPEAAAAMSMLGIDVSPIETLDDLVVLFDQLKVLATSLASQPGFSFERLGFDPTSIIVTKTATGEYVIGQFVPSSSSLVPEGGWQISVVGSDYILAITLTTSGTSLPEGCLEEVLAMLGVDQESESTPSEQTGTVSGSISTTGTQSTGADSSFFGFGDAGTSN